MDEFSSGPRVSTNEVEVDVETLAALDRDIKHADEGRTVHIDEVRKVFPKLDFQVRITEPAVADFEEILAYSWANVSSHCRTVWQRNTESCRSAEDPSRKVDSSPDGRPHVRQPVHTPILIYYRVNESPKFVEVLHLWHRSRQRAF